MCDVYFSHQGCNAFMRRFSEEKDSLSVNRYFTASAFLFYLIRRTSKKKQSNSPINSPVIEPSLALIFFNNPFHSNVHHNTEKKDMSLLALHREVCHFSATTCIKWNCRLFVLTTLGQCCEFEVRLVFCHPMEEWRDFFFLAVPHGSWTSWTEITRFTNISMYITHTLSHLYNHNTY